MHPDPGNLRWLFVDMDSFFASAEQHLRPELRGRPVGVAPVATEHTCIIAASRDAKSTGVKVGTPVREARRLCPGIQIVKARPAVYVLLHEDILKAVETCAPVHKVYSIDEWSIRLAPNERTREGAIALGAKIQRTLRETFSPCLSGSIGIAPTRLLAKIASDLEKPSGLVALDTSDLPHRLSHLKLADLPGIAHGMTPRLERAGVRTIEDLWRLTEQGSRAAWGSVQGQHWWLGFHGHDVPEPRTTRKSIGHGHVLPPEHRCDAGAHGILVRLITKGAWRLRHHNYFAHRLHVSISGRDTPGWHAQAPLESEQDTIPILQAFESLWRTRPWARHARATRDAACDDARFLKVSMTLTGLTPGESTTRPLFAEPAARRHRLAETIDRINARIGQHAVYTGATHDFRHELEEKIAFGRVPRDAMRMAGQAV